MGLGGRVTILAETTYARDVDGSPIYRVLELLPEYWAQPWGRAPRQPSNFTGSPGVRAKDFAGTPATTYRSYAMDNGLERRALSLPDATKIPTALRMTQPQFNPRAFFVNFEAQAGLTYELQRVKKLGGALEIVSTFDVTVSGPLSIAAAPQGDMGFFLLRVRPTISN